jgi:iron complex transport system substrate-binding protein
VHRRITALALGALAVLGACGSDSGSSTAPPATTAAATTTSAATTVAPTTTIAAVTLPATVSFPLTVTAGNGDVTIKAKPERIVSLSPTATEMLFAVGAGSQVVAVDDQSTYPPEAPKTTLSGFDPNLEAIAGYNPDLVVISNDIKGLVAGLDTLNLPTLLLPAATKLEDTYDQMALLGKATGNEAAGITAADQVRSDMAELVAKVQPSKRGSTYYHELDPTLYTAISTTFIGQIYALAGLENVADPADDGSGYPQLSAEFLVKADPDLIFLADTICCQQDAATVAARPGWSSMTAVKNDGVVKLDDDIASRWGPRIVDFLKVVVDAVNKVPAG